MLKWVTLILSPITAVWLIRENVYLIHKMGEQVSDRTATKFINLLDWHFWVPESYPSILADYFGM